MFKSNTLYAKVKGQYALFTTPESKASGEKVSYQVPTKQALHGIADAIYFKPVIRNVIDEVKVMNPIMTSVVGIRTLIGSGKENTADLNYYSYLSNVEYLIKFHFEWNTDRPDLAHDRNEKKHEEIFLRSISKGGRRDVFLGTRECVATIEEIDSEYYNNSKSYYFGEKISFGIMFQEFIYPSTNKGKLFSCYDEIEMKDGIIRFKDANQCKIQNELSEYTFNIGCGYKSVDDELNEYGREV